MGFSDVWNRTLVYFGIAEEEDWDEDGYATNEELERSYRERPNVRRLSPRRQRQAEFEEWTDDAAAQTEVVRPARLRGVQAPSASVRVHLVLPRNARDCSSAAASSTRPERQGSRAPGPNLSEWAQTPSLSCLPTRSRTSRSSSGYSSSSTG